MPASACPFSSSHRPRTAAENAAGLTAAATGAAAAATAAHTKKEPLPIPCFPHEPSEVPGGWVQDHLSGSVLGVQQREAQGATRCGQVPSCVTQESVNTKEPRRRCSSNSKCSSSSSTLEPQHLMQPAHQQQQHQQPQHANLFHQPPQHHDRRVHTAANEGWSNPDCCSSTPATAHRRTSANRLRCCHPAAAAAAAAASGGSASPAAAHSSHRNGQLRQQAAAAADTGEHCSSPLAAAGPRGRCSLDHAPDHACPAAGWPSRCEKQSRAAVAAAAVTPAANDLAACRVTSRPGRLRHACRAPVRTTAFTGPARDVSASVAARSSRSSINGISPAKAVQRRRYSSDAVNLNLEPVSLQQRGSGQQALHHQQRHQQQQRPKHLIVQPNAQQRLHQQQDAIKPCTGSEYSFLGEASSVNDPRCSVHQQHQHQQRVLLERLQVYRRHRSHQHMTPAKDTRGDSVARTRSREAACPCPAALAVRPEHRAPSGRAAPATVVVAAAAKLGIAPSAAFATTNISLKGPTTFSQNCVAPDVCNSDERQHSRQAQQQPLVNKQQLLPQLHRQQLYASAVLERFFRVLERSAYRRPWRMLLCQAAQRQQKQQQHSRKLEKLPTDETSTELEGLSTIEEASSIDTCMRLEVYRRRLQHQQQRRKQLQQRQKEQHEQHKQQRRQLTQQLAAAAEELKKANDQQEVLQERLAAALSRLKHLEQQQPQQQRVLH
ncbi:hypothetical protein Esti_004508 [Eimeria stiedai]